jgi:hypothetical protein
MRAMPSQALFPGPGADEGPDRLSGLSALVPHGPAATRMGSGGSPVVPQRH